MTTQKLISNLTKNGATFRIEGTRLAVDAPRGLLSQEERQTLSTRKWQVLRILKRQKSNHTKRILLGDWIEWDNPLLGRRKGKVVMSPEKGWLVVRHHSVTGDLALLPESLVVQVGGKSLTD